MSEVISGWVKSEESLTFLQWYQLRYTDCTVEIIEDY